MPHMGKHTTLQTLRKRQQTSSTNSNHRMEIKKLTTSILKQKIEDKNKHTDSHRSSLQRHTNEQNYGTTPLIALKAQHNSLP